MKTRVDAKRKYVTYDVGQWVYVKLRPFHQCSVTNNLHRKLAKHFFRPFQIIERVGQVAYRLHLPTATQLHNDFHCPLLWAHHGPLPTEPNPWPLTTINNQLVPQPLSILDSILDRTTDPPIYLVLVQWMGQALEDTSWETWEDVRDTYHLEDKMDFGEGGIVSNSPEVHIRRPKRDTTCLAYLQD